MKLCARCRLPEQDHATITENDHGIIRPIGPLNPLACHHYEPRAPWWLRTLTNILGKADR